MHTPSFSLKCKSCKGKTTVLYGKERLCKSCKDLKKKMNQITPIIELEDKEDTKYLPLLKELRKKAKKENMEIRLTIVINGKGKSEKNDE